MKKLIVYILNPNQVLFYVRDDGYRAAEVLEHLARGWRLAAVEIVPRRQLFSDWMLAVVPMTWAQILGLEKTSFFFSVAIFS